MWTEITRPDYDRSGLRYASDLADAVWALIEPFLPAPGRIGRPRATDLREVVNALFYMATTGCQWRRLPKVLENTSGFLYYVSITGITGAAAAQAEAVGPEVARIKAATEIPVCVGFGIKTPEGAAAIASVADGAVVGSAIVERIGRGDAPADILAFVKSLADAAHGV